MKKLLSDNPYFYGCFALFWLIGFYVQLSYTQFEISIAINSLHTEFGDFIMKYTTYFGDGYFLVLVGAFIIFLNRKLWFVTITCLTIPSLITQVLKLYIFEDHHRPSVLMSQIPNLHYVEDVVMNQFNSFPSGHTTAAFSLYLLLALISNNKSLGFVWCIIAASIAFSRVYLLQHFWVDILVGSFIATFTVTILYAMFIPKLTSDDTTKA